MKREDITTDVYEAIGYASLCWKEVPKGVFDDQKASQCAEDLINKILEIANK